MAQLPAPTLIQRTAPRATWTAVTTAGLTTGVTTSPPTVNGTFRADNPGAVGQDKLWIFGGSLGNNTSYTANDLWAFDPVAGTMTQVIADGAAGSPSHRGRSAIAWNPTNNKLTVFGGDSRGGPTGTGTATLLGDTWEFDPATSTWANVTPATSPSPRRWATLAHDPITGGMLLFGGETAMTTPPTYSNETWLWIGGIWTQLSTSTTPAARSLHSMVTRTDSFQDVVMLGGGNNAMATPDQIRFLDVWRWNGADWQLLSDCDVTTNPTGAGTTWPASTLGNQAVYDPLRQRIVVQGGNGITVAANTIYVYGPSYGGSPTNYTSEFDSLTNQWSIYASPTTGTTPFNNTDTVLGRVSRYFVGFVPATGKVYKACGQDPTKSGSKPTYSVYAYQANPVATTTSYGAGCNGVGGPMVLTADNAPWTGRTFSATSTGFGPLSFCLGVVGLTQVSIPMVAVLPVGGLGCDVLANPDLMVAVLPTAGSAQITFPLPNTPSLGGLSLYFQAAELAFDLGGNIVGLSGSNGLTATIGAL
ncbi:MAG: hypothetical protein JNK15_00575 [Planctomycetes bacterium]|nr:hypothetical protein [Planctomycetota bacterium]